MTQSSSPQQQEEHRDLKVRVEDLWWLDETGCEPAVQVGWKLSVEGVHPQGQPLELGHSAWRLEDAERLLAQFALFGVEVTDRGDLDEAAEAVVGREATLRVPAGSDVAEAFSGLHEDWWTPTETQRVAREKFYGFWLPREAVDVSEDTTVMPPRPGMDPEDAIREIEAQWAAEAAARDDRAADTGAEVGEDEREADGEGPAPVPPGIYRVAVVGTLVERTDDGMDLLWEMVVTGPLGKRGRVAKRSRVATPEDAQALRREFAVLGVPLGTWRGLDRAREALVNEEAFVEVLPSSEPEWGRVQILQRATTHELAAPGEHGLTGWETAARQADLDFHFRSEVRSALWDGPVPR